MLEYSFRSLNELHRINGNLEKKIPRHADGVASHQRIVSEAARDGAWTVDGLCGVEPCFAPRCHWRSFVTHRQNTVRSCPRSSEVMWIVRWRSRRLCERK